MAGVLLRLLAWCLEFEISSLGGQIDELLHRRERALERLKKIREAQKSQLKKSGRNGIVPLVPDPRRRFIPPPTGHLGHASAPTVKLDLPERVNMQRFRN